MLDCVSSKEIGSNSYACGRYTIGKEIDDMVMDSCTVARLHCFLTTNNKINSIVNSTRNHTYAHTKIAVSQIFQLVFGIGG